MQTMVVSAEANAAGSERSLVGLLAHLPAAGIEPVTVVLADGPLLGWLDAAGLDYRHVDSGRLRDPAAVRRTAARLRNLARDRRVEVAFSNSPQGHVYSWFALRGTATPLVWWQRNRPTLGGRFDLAASLVPAAALVCSNDEVVRSQRRLVPWRRVEKVWPGVDVSGIAARRGEGAALRAARGWSGHRLVGIVGRLEPWKGQETFLRAAAALADLHPDVRFLVVGGAVIGNEGEYPARLRALATSLRIADRVDFVGHQDDVVPWFDALDVVVHASAGEPFGRVLVEALALGRPLVAARSAGTAEIVDEGSGVLTAAGDVPALVSAVDGLLRDPRRAQALGAAGARRAQLFSEEHSAAALAAVLRAAAERRRRQ